MFKFWNFIFILVLYIQLDITVCQDVIVNITQGQLRGTPQVTHSGLPYYSFLGIPYAQPPVGPLRFKAPQPADSWDGIRDANQLGASCEGSEDCLYINVVTPQLPSDGTLLNTMVYIHGGAFSAGNGGGVPGTSDNYLEENFVVVSLNYRLGPLGFLSTGDSVIPGNYGLKDQTSALQWVQQNIAQFGGDPTKVTIFGLSAGGASVHYQILSPLSKGLFQNAIGESGSALNPWAFDETSTARNRTLRYAAALGATTQDSAELLDFFNSLTFQELLNGVGLAQTDFERNHDIVYFVPTVEPQSDEAFLTDLPLNIIQQGTFNQVPFLTGTVSQEGILLLGEVYNNPTATDYYDSNFVLTLPENLLLNVDSATAQEIAARVKQLYFGNTKLSQQTLRQYIDYLSDILFLNGINTHSRLMGTVSTAPVYQYFFSFSGRLGNTLKYIGDIFPGVGHGDEEGYLFYYPPSFDYEGSPEQLTSQRMVRLWTNFARTGNPTPELDPLLQNITWYPDTALNHFYLDIGDDLVLLRDVDYSDMEFWNSIYSSIQA